MSHSAKQLAHNASFQTFINCYLREIDAGVWHSPEEWRLKTGFDIGQNTPYLIEVQLDKPRSTLVFGVSFRSIVGRHTITEVYQQYQNQWGWQRVETLDTIFLLVNNIYSRPNVEANTTPDQKLELLARIIESHQVMTNYIDRRIDDPTLHDNSFIASEQSILFGHWLHPTPKSRQGMHDWQHSCYSPELGEKFQLHFFAVSKDLTEQASILPDSTSDIILRLIEQTPDNNANESIQRIPSLTPKMNFIAVHPLQGQWLLHQTYCQDLIQEGKLINLDRLGPLFTATSSVRTVFCEAFDYMIKLSIPVKITNSKRINMRHELNAGVAVASLLKKCAFTRTYPEFQTIDDPAYITLDLPGRVESGFEVIIRENPFKRSDKTKDENTTLSIAAIAQDPITPDQPSRLRSMVEKLAKARNCSVQQAALFWFDAYWQCAIDKTLLLYDKHGIALEVHQQNSLLEISEGYPTQYYYRDNQGFYLSETKKSQLLAIEPKLKDCEELFYSTPMINDRFSYYLVVNQLFSVINRFALDDLISEIDLLKRTCQKLQTLMTHMQGPGHDLVRSILERTDIPCKGNLLTRIDDVDELEAELELAVYTKFKNPLKAIHEESLSRSEDQSVHGAAHRESA